MKTLNKIWGIGLLASLLLLAAPTRSKAQQGEYISDQEFYDDLEPDGTWVSDPQYGNVWVPNAEEGFRPYATRGHWVQTEYGTTWVSDYRWGWATFHYGRWRYDDYYGWEWIPGHEWAPAWVSWRHGGGYYGWAPLLPGISISISIGNGYRVPDNYWVCAPQAYINRPNIYNYYVPHARAVTIIHNTTIINNTYVTNNRTYITGPRVQEIRQVTRQNVQVYKINNASRPGAINVQNNTVNIYRPAVNKAPNARPTRVVDGNAYKQQNPNQAIGHRGTGGAAAFNRANAQKLAMVARDPKPDNKVVRVNPVAARPAVTPGQPANKPNPAQPGNRPEQPANKPNPARPGNRPEQPANKPNPARPGNRPEQPANKPNPAQPDNNAKVEQLRQQAAQQAQQKQQAAQQAQQRQQAQQKQQADQQAQQRQQAQQAAQQAQQKQQAAQQAQQRQQAAQQAQQKQQAAQQAQQRQQAAQQAQQRQQAQQAAQQAQQRQQAAQQAQQRQQAAQQAQQRQQAAQRQQQQKAKPKPQPQQEPRKDQ